MCNTKCVILLFPPKSERWGAFSLHGGGGETGKGGGLHKNRALRRGHRFPASLQNGGIFDVFKHLIDANFSVSKHFLSINFDVSKHFSIFATGNNINGNYMDAPCRKGSTTTQNERTI